MMSFAMSTSKPARRIPASDPPHPENNDTAVGIRIPLERWRLYGFTTVNTDQESHSVQRPLVATGFHLTQLSVHRPFSCLLCGIQPP
ncbi:hypothetical protein D3C76_1725960 [compost metagenome]